MARCANRDGRLSAVAHARGALSLLAGKLHDFELGYRRIKQVHAAKTYVERINDIKEFKKVLRTKINVLVLFANGLNGLCLL